jgi:cardiolipin synthase
MRLYFGPRLAQDLGVKVPKPRNLIIGVVIVLIIVGMGLVIAQDQETLRVRTSLAATAPEYPSYLAKLSGHALTAGDRYTVLTNGDQAFPAMLAAIHEARHRVAFEGYIYNSASDIARQFTDAFVAAAGRGVDVRLVFDSLGAQVSKADIEELQKAGCHLGWYNKVRSRAIEEVNYRTHRKALIVDGEVAFVGGIGIDDQWAASKDKKPRWRDTHVKVVGPAATDVEAAFNENWIETGGVVEPDVVPHDPNPRGPASSIVIWSSPEGGTNALKLSYLLLLAAARQSIDIQSPYLITDASTEWSLTEARKRGVRVRMLVEGDVTDAKPVKFASRAEYGRLMQRGIEISEYQPSMMHAKAVTIDDTVSIVGSANFDNRSFELNDELNVVVFDRGVAKRLREDFERDLGQARRLDLQSWRSRPLHIRAREKVWSLFDEIF